MPSLTVAPPVKVFFAVSVHAPDPVFASARAEPSAASLRTPAHVAATAVLFASVRTAVPSVPETSTGLITVSAPTPPCSTVAAASTEAVGS